MMHTLRKVFAELPNGGAGRGGHPIVHIYGTKSHSASSSIPLIPTQPPKRRNGSHEFDRLREQSKQFKNSLYRMVAIHVVAKLANVVAEIGAGSLVGSFREA